MRVLKPEQYEKALPALMQVSINNFFARSVVERMVNGTVYADDVDKPRTFYVVHPYGMSLLFGDPANEEFNRAFLAHALNAGKARSSYEWMQAFPGGWDDTLRKLFGEKLVAVDANAGNADGMIELNTRVNFKFDAGRFAQTRKPLADPGITVKRTDRETFRNMKGSVVPAYFWNSEDHFLEKGVGYSLFYNGQLASTAYASFIHDDKLELGIETIGELRGKGLAYHACAALIDHCLENNFEPVWACRLANTGSYVLAQKLGFQPAAKIPYYRLCN
jgi:hypothetical protein